MPLPTTTSRDRDGDGAECFKRRVSVMNIRGQAAVLSRGLVGNLGERLVVASPIYKHHFDLRTGECLEAPEHSVNAYPARVYDGKVWVAADVTMSEVEEELAA